MAAAGLDVLVVGAGVIGLTTAVHLAESRLLVEVRTTVPPGQTSSAAAGAMWSLALVECTERIVQWSRDTFERLRELAGDPRTGVRLVTGVEASRTELIPVDRLAFLTGIRVCEPAELPPGFVSGRRFTAPLVDMPVYLDYLRGRLAAAGGRLVVEPVRSLDEVFGQADVVVNCTGAWAADLVDDPDLYPVRGEVVVVANPGVTEFFAEESGDDRDMLYILPHGDKVVLGGTAEPGNWSRDPDPGAARAIVARCAAIVPSLATAPVLGHRVGVRPGRGRVRLDEQAKPNGGRLIHSYGHGGAGLSLSWGCAHAVLDRLDASSVR